MGAAAGYFIGQRLSLPDFADEQAYLLRGRLLLDLDDGQGFTLWTEVPTFAGAGPDDHVFMIDAVAGRIVFGDGANGRRPPGDSGTVSAKYERVQHPSSQ